MSFNFYIYNSLSREKEAFTPMYPPHVGMYVCGPTVYGEPHLGHARMTITFDVLYRYLKHLGYKVRYVRNITDVGHLEDEVAGEGQDRITKRARLEKLEPMEIVQKYKNIFQEIYQKMNVLSPDIEPLASGHIIEQQKMIEKILNSGYAYEKNGSVYFDIEKYDHDHHYGILSGRKIEDLLVNTRSLEGQDEKKFPLDFALWKKAGPEHIMKWPSPWSEGFPGWHLECSAMGTKYLGEQFDIHGGGMDLLFPHHECEIAQSTAANGKTHVRYWMHNNMITINGQKMAKSLNNFITLNELFNGDHEKLKQGYSPMTVRFFILQAHYRSTLDFSNEALQSAEKGLKRLMNGVQTIGKLTVSEKSDFDLDGFEEKCYSALNDDLNTPVLISYLFDGVKFINSVKEGKAFINIEHKSRIRKLYSYLITDILGLNIEDDKKADKGKLSAMINFMLNFRHEAKQNKDFETADRIRNELTRLGVSVKDTRDGFEWEIE